MTEDAETAREPTQLTVLDRLLQPVSRVRPGEGLVAALLLACMFLILMSFYVMKTAREGMILARGSFGLRGQELKTYATAGMALILCVLVPAYATVATRVRRIKLVDCSYFVVLASLGVFFVLDTLGLSIGVPFFVWIGLVNVFLVAQFWSYANDLYNEEQGKRLFAIIALGGALGGVVGPPIASIVPASALLPIGAATLLPCIALFHVIERIQARTPSGQARARAPVDGRGAFDLVLRDRYLLLIAALVFIGSLVKTTGEYVLSDAAAHRAIELVPATAHAELVGAARTHAIIQDRSEAIDHIYASFFFWVNLVSFLIQALVVSRAIAKLGVRRALFVMPIVALGAYGLIAAIGGFALVRAAKVAENGTEYSLDNTVRQTLFLPTGRAAKYKAKAAIDTLAVRAGDSASALLIWIAIHQIGMRGRGLAFVNVALVAAWLAIAAGLVHRHRALRVIQEAPT
ncbi:MAG TPA: Npt1/Npt2 family nucleotide transporter [Kofleriaceae bacterium]|jgi:AAA family ATP:ADP antiporter